MHFEVIARRFAWGRIIWLEMKKSKNILLLLTHNILGATCNPKIFSLVGLLHQDYICFYRIQVKRGIATQQITDRRVVGDPHLLLEEDSAVLAVAEAGRLHLLAALGADEVNPCTLLDNLSTCALLIWNFYSAFDLSHTVVTRDLCHTVMTSSGEKFDLKLLWSDRWRAGERWKNFTFRISSHDNDSHFFWYIH